MFRVGAGVGVVHRVEDGGRGVAQLGISVFHTNIRRQFFKIEIHLSRLATTPVYAFIILVPQSYL